jgi:ABC-2 type transport system ATP-binding protein
MKLRRGRLRMLIAITVVAFVAAGMVGWLATRGGAGGVRTLSTRIVVTDGPHDDQHVSLDATFYTPSDRHGRVPAILVAHGFGGSKDDVREEAETLTRHGYAVLAWSARGFGRTTGEISLDSPDYDVKDVRQLVDWLARRPEVQLDRSGDPRVGITGASYGGAISLLASAYDPRIDATVPQITWYDLADALFPNAGGTGARAGVFKKLWAGIFFAGGSASGSGGSCGRFLPSICAMYQKVAETGRPTAEAVAMLRRSSPSSVAGRIHAPTLLIQGQTDSLFPFDQADANARAITGAPVSVLWYQGGHDGGDPETARVNGAMRDWFDRYLDGKGPAQPAFTVTRAGGIDSSTQQQRISAATSARYPGLFGSGSRMLPLSGAPQTVQNPAGGAPAALSALPGFGALSTFDTLPSGGGTGGAGGGLGVDTPGQQAVFDSAPLPQALRLTGSARVRVHASAQATLFAKIYDVGSDGRIALTRRLVSPVTIAPGQADPVISLPPMDYRFDRGHRIRVVLSTTDMGYAMPAKPASYQVSVTSPLTVPVDPDLATPPSPLPWWTWGLPLIALAVMAGLMLTGRGRGRARGTVVGDENVPLKITQLTKRYKNGLLAVDDLSFEVERGQVLGLLGPNGAGKTTTLRMLMGLITPDSGAIELFGRRVSPGAPVLSRIGSFVEGPGFLPHLPGHDNLTLYWRATGRPAEDSHLTEALDIAGLGDALNRPVRTYSHGMRQRLAIAQAMLGLPDLLVLDEPTNGLDPPQIAEMREVLTRYAATGRTVIVSSHLLAEVEKTCTHVVVMHRGTQVATGPVAQIAGQEGSYIIGTSDADRAVAVLESLEGVERVEPYPPGVLAQLNGTPPSEAVATLVAAGLKVDRVMPHRRLEDAFLTLIGQGADNG